MGREYPFHHHKISIHALREEGDDPQLSSNAGTADFYPRPPRGGRPTISGQDKALGLFLSTPSARRATYSAIRSQRTSRISIHALREEGDEGQCSGFQGRGDFYPRPPRGGRRRSPGRTRPSVISIHALREEGDYFF